MPGAPSRSPSRSDLASCCSTSLTAVATWIPVLVAVLSAALAGWFAVITKRSELRSQRLIELERQSAATKAEVFQPLAEGIGEMWEQSSKGEATPEWFEKNVMPRFKRFMTWAPIYGADETVWAYHRYIQGIYADAPVDITMRHLADLVLALRRELGHPGSKVTALDLMGFRINDIYQNGVGLPWTRFSLQDLYSAAAWTPPWGDRFKYGKPLK
jgi:hypothetical protein